MDENSIAHTKWESVPELAGVCNATFRKMDVASMTYDNETFTVVMYEAIGHLNYVMDKALNECMRVLKKHGSLIVVSSSKMDKRVIADRLISLLKNRGLIYEPTEEKVFTYVRIFNR